MLPGTAYGYEHPKPWTMPKVWRDEPRIYRLDPPIECVDHVDGTFMTRYVVRLKRPAGMRGLYACDECGHLMDAEWVTESHGLEEAIPDSDLLAQIHYEILNEDELED